MAKNRVCCCTITWVFRPSDPLPPGMWPQKMAPQVLADIKGAGYDGVEKLGAKIEDLDGVEGVRALIEESGLELIRIGSGSDLRAGLAMMKELGVVCHMAGSPHRKDFPGGAPPPEVYRTISAELEETARISLQEFGIPTALHNHLWTAAESREEIDRLFEGTKHLRLMLDVAHLGATGADVVGAIRDYADRIVHVHIKDWDSARYSEEPFEPGFVELGAGNVGLDIPACLAALEEVGYGGWLGVELDTSDTPFESNRRNREYLARLGY